MILLGSDGDKTISPIDWAKESNTIPWEIICSFKNRLSRVQVDQTFRLNKKFCMFAKKLIMYKNWRGG